MRILVSTTAAIAAFCWVWLVVWVAGADVFARSLNNAFWLIVSSFAAVIIFIVVAVEYRSKEE